MSYPKKVSAVLIDSEHIVLLEAAGFGVDIIGLGFRIDDTLCQMETLGSYFSNGSLHGNMVRTINLRKEICFNMDDNDAILFPIYIRAYGSEIFRFPKS